MQTWCCANITGFCNAEAALSWQADLVGISELRGDPEEAKKLGKQHGKAVACSAPDDEGKCLVGIYFCGTKGKAVAVPCRAGWDTRLAAVQVRLSRSLICTAVCIYGHSSPSREQLEELDQQLMMLLEYYAVQGRGPMVVMGDLNAVEAQLAATVLARRSGWQDLSDEGTCVTASSVAARRIDQVWVSPTLGGRSSPAVVLWSEGLPTHAVQSWTVLAEEAGRLDHWQVADAGPEEDEGAFTDQEWAAHFDERATSWQDLVVSQDVDGMWATIEEKLVECHQLRAPGFQKPQGRVVNKCEESPQNPFSGSAETAATAAATKRKRILQQLLLLHGREDRELQQRELRQALCKDPVAEWAAMGAFPQNREVLEFMVARAQDAAEEARRAECDSRRASWRSWVQGETEGSMKNLYKYIKNGPASLIQLGLWTNPEGQVFAGKAALLHSSEAAWWPLWRPGGQGATRPAGFQHYDTLALQSLSARRLANAAWQSAPGKAPGADGWSVKRMRQWPDGVWRAVAALIYAVEQTGRWPEALRGGIICLTPKGGVQASAQAPLEARPIVLLAQLYRIWAAARAVDLLRWIDFHKLSPLEDAQGNQAAEELGLLAAGMLEEAEATKKDGALLALDQSKAYDRVPLDLLAELLRDSGVHPSIGGPMLCMARSRRRIKVLDAIGEARHPTSGLVPGCPMATFMEGLLMLRWRLFVGGPLPRLLVNLGQAPGGLLASTSEKKAARAAVLGRRFHDGRHRHRGERCHGRAGSEGH